MAGQTSKATRALERAHANASKALERAMRELADIPLGQTRHDPRTEKKRAEANQIDSLMDTTLTRITHELHQGKGK